MFESFVADRITKVLGDYVCLNSSDIQVGIWNGSLELNNTRLNPQLLDNLAVPVPAYKFEVLYGLIGHLSVRIPWTHLRSQSIRIEISDVTLVLSPKYLRWDDQLEKHQTEYAERKKQAQLADGSPLHARAGEGDKGAPSSSWKKWLLSYLLESIQVTLKNIHIRYEDAISVDRPFAGGIVLKGLEITSTAKDYEDYQILGKRLAVSKVSFYWKSNAAAIAYEYSKETIATLAALVEESEKWSLLVPLDLALDVKARLTGSDGLLLVMETPSASAAASATKESVDGIDPIDAFLRCRGCC